MQRLTFMDGHGRNTILINGQEYHGPIADRLAAYEETGLEPEEVRGIKTAYDEVQIPYEVVATGADAARVIRLLDAEDEGRLIVLPCKVGDIIYEVDRPEYGVIVCKVLWVDSYMGPEQHVEGNEQIFTHLCNVEVIDGHGKGSSYSFAPDEFGESVFLTREGAEAALEAKRHG